METTFFVLNKVLPGNLFYFKMVVSKESFLIITAIKNSFSPGCSPDEESKVRKWRYGTIEELQRTISFF